MGKLIISVLIACLVIYFWGDDIKSYIKNDIQETNNKYEIQVQQEKQKEQEYLQWREDHPEEAKKQDEERMKQQAEQQRENNENNDFYNNIINQMMWNSVNN